MTLKYLSVIILLFYTCKSKINDDAIEAWKKELFDTEIAFSDMAQKEGIQQAFVYFAADDAIILRNEKLIQGKKSIGELYEKNNASSDHTSLTWKPDFVDVSAAGDLGYTYGKYVFSSTDSLGNTSSSEGIFHTVWKKQSDGNWRFVWD